MVDTIGGCKLERDGTPILRQARVRQATAGILAKASFLRSSWSA